MSRYLKNPCNIKCYYGNYNFVTYNYSSENDG